MRKKVFIATDSLTCGGAERALVSFLNAIDYGKYSVDLLYFCHENEQLKDEIPEEVHILEVNERIQLALSSKSYVLSHIYKLKYILLILFRIFVGIRNKIYKEGTYKLRAKDWKILSKFIPELPKTYDVAIGFLETYPVYFSIDKVKACRYIAWQRTDYKTTGCCSKWDYTFFDRADYICVLSDEMKNNLGMEFPEFKDKIVIFPNFRDIIGIMEKSKESIEFDDYTGIRIISVGTIRGVKGYDVAIKAGKLLVQRGYDFRWYILGDGEEKKSLQEKIKEYGIEKNFILLGNKMNPYPYMANSSIFVQCSYREGFSSTVFEAKCLALPIVITDAPGMGSQIDNGENGLIVPVGNYIMVANAIEKLICSATLREEFSRKLENFAEQYMEIKKEKLELFDNMCGSNG